MAGKKIGKYTVIKELGQGAFASVYLAEENGRSDRVAIKKFSEAARNTFNNESEIYQSIEKLKNPHILSLQDTAEDDDGPYMVFQRAQEETLRDQIKQMSGKPFGAERALAILRQVGKAVIAIHDKNVNIIHGDIRPENILFDENNQAILADFGIAVRLLPTENRYAPSPQGYPLYMAPERFGKNSFLARESDQYALGCIAYELFIGRHPLGLVTSQDVRPQDVKLIEKKIRTTKFDDLCEYNKFFPSFIEKAILKALAQNVEERHSNVREFIEKLTEEPAGIGYGRPDRTQQSLLQNLEMPEEGYFKHLTLFLIDNINGYSPARMTEFGGIDPFYYTMVTKGSEERNLVYVPAEFIVHPGREQYNAIYVVIQQLLQTERPSLIFYDSYEAPAYNIIKICDLRKPLQAGIWFMPMKYTYDFEAAGEAQKEWVENLWNMTRSYKTRKNNP